MHEESDSDPQDPKQEVCGFDTNVIDVPAMADRRLRAVNRTFKQTITEDPKHPKPSIREFESSRPDAPVEPVADDPLPAGGTAQEPSTPEEGKTVMESAEKKETEDTPKKDPLLTTSTSTRVALPRPPSRPSQPKPPPSTSKSETNLPTIEANKDPVQKVPTSDPDAVNTDTQYLIKKLKNLPKPPGK